MNEYTFLIVFAILTIANAGVLLFTRNERKMIKKLEKEILSEVDEASIILDKFLIAMREIAIDPEKQLEP